MQCILVEVWNDPPFCVGIPADAGDILFEREVCF